MKLGDGLLRLIHRVTDDLDVARIRADVESFRARNATLSTRRKAERLIGITARKAALVGAAAGLPAGWGAALAAAPELTTLVVLQSRLIVGIHMLYGQDMDPGDRSGEILAGIAAGAGMQVGRRLTLRAAEEVAARLAARAVGREALHTVPLVGVAAGAILNYLVVEAVGKAVLARAERRWGPPEIAGSGPVVDVGGLVS